VASTVFVVTPKPSVTESLVFVLVDVVVVVTLLGVTVLIFLAVPLGTVTVENGPVVRTSVEVVVVVCVTIGVSTKS
jgi:hypothetical protein